jgi:hypothetical protein
VSCLLMQKAECSHVCAILPQSLLVSSQFVVMINDLWLLSNRPMVCLVINVFCLYFFMLYMDINKLQFCFVLFLIACGIAVCVLAYYFFFCRNVIWNILINYKCL